MATSKTQKTRLINVLQRGYEQGSVFTTKQLASRIKAPTASVRRLIGELRLDGYPIYRNTKYTGNGETTFAYGLGEPSPDMVAAAALFVGPSLFR